MIKVEDNTLKDFERHRIITFNGSEREIDYLVEILQILEPVLEDHGFSRKEIQAYHDFVHSFSSACCW